MNQSELPTSIQFPAERFSNPYPYRVTSQSGKLCSIEVLDSKPLIPGQTIRFKEGVVGILLKGVNVLLEREVAVSQGHLQSFMSVPPPQTLVLVPNTSVGSLRVKCKVSGSYPAGYLGWGLEGPQGLIAVGNDAQEAGFAAFQGTGIFEPGLYTLRITRYTDPFLQPLSTAVRIWELSSPLGILQAGDYHDNSAPILIS